MEIKSKIERGISQMGIKRRHKAKIIVFLLCQVFCVYSLIRFLIKKQIVCVLLALLTMVLLCIPWAMERICSCVIFLPVYLFILLYALGPLLGDGYNLYYLTDWWDKTMHLSSGVLFGMLGAFLPELLQKEVKPSLAMRTVFAIFFSMGISAVWEFFEFAVDMLLAGDMQNDTVITEINSYLIGPELGTIGHLQGIENVVVNGQVMEGYIDIGLIDTMMDMLIESAGAVGYSVFFFLDKDRHPIFTPLRAKAA